MSLFSAQHLAELLHSYGFVAVAVTVGLESVGIPLPGETALIAAAVLAATTHEVDIAMVILSALLGSIVGQTLGYAIGSAVGFRLLRRYGRYLGLTDRRLAYGRALFRRHGVKVIVAARFVALLRALAALLAGANRMPFGLFMTANVVGSVLWSTLYGLGAYFLGHEAKHVAGPFALSIGVLVVAAALATWFLARRREQRLLARRS